MKTKVKLKPHINDHFTKLAKSACILPKIPSVVTLDSSQPQPQTLSQSHALSPEKAIHDFLSQAVGLVEKEIKIMEKQGQIMGDALIDQDHTIVGPELCPSNPEKELTLVRSPPLLANKVLPRPSSTTTKAIVHSTTFNGPNVQSLSLPTCSKNPVKRKSREANKKESQGPPSKKCSKEATPPLATFLSPPVPRWG